DRAAGDAAAGALVARPGRDLRPDRRAGAGPGHEPAAAAVLRPRRCPARVLVRRLPADARLPDAGRVVPTGAAQARLPGRGPHDRARGDRGGVRGHGARRDAAQRGPNPRLVFELVKRLCELSGPSGQEGPVIDEVERLWRESGLATERTRIGTLVGR